MGPHSLTGHVRLPVQRVCFYTNGGEARFACRARWLAFVHSRNRTEAGTRYRPAGTRSGSCFQASSRPLSRGAPQSSIALNKSLILDRIQRKFVRETSAPASQEFFNVVIQNLAAAVVVLPDATPI